MVVLRNVVHVTSACFLLSAVARAATLQTGEQDCGHGEAIIDVKANTRSCSCYEGWRTSGATDSLNFLSGRCEQFMCTSNSDCAKRLGIDNATCLVEGWNCVCGWSHATGFFGGFETPGRGGAKCMGVMYLVSEKMVTFSIWMVQRTWVWMFWLIVLALPFGEKKICCQCHNPRNFQIPFGIWKFFFGRPFDCNGDCVHPTTWTFWHLHYDFAWSLFFFDIAVWVLGLNLVFYTTALLLSTMLGLACLTLLIVFTLFLWLVVICYDYLPCGAVVGGINCECCNNYSGTEIDIFYFGGPTPDSTDCGLRCCICRPVAWVLIRFPKHPRNLWGGFFGYYVLGTHQFSRTTYDGSSCFINSLSFVGSQDLHENSTWRQQVHDFILGPRPETRIRSNVIITAAPPVQIRMNQALRQAQTQQDGAPAPRTRVSSFEHSSEIARIVFQDHPFEKIDKCHPSTLEDYLEGTCWICCKKGASETWDAWVSCGHLFCTHCSDEMLHRRMPCPLCRTVSTTVRRGPASYVAPT
eukprot:TRINITY_DN55286_c0_g1_i1.p1 TRINITY_DN55286_c0_g1~~TRINITY_DN55286_c0_g1_i1.p1  ORF type:complete len:523 (+),score=43.83 TRINITY_DN55286_c0_g1_i1:61-1629(+)